MLWSSSPRSSSGSFSTRPSTNTGGTSWHPSSLSGGGADSVLCRAGDGAQVEENWRGRCVHCLTAASIPSTEERVSARNLMSRSAFLPYLTTCPSSVRSPPMVGEWMDSEISPPLGVEQEKKKKKKSSSSSSSLFSFFFGGEVQKNAAVCAASMRSCDSLLSSGSTFVAPASSLTVSSNPSSSPSSCSPSFLNGFTTNSTTSLADMSTGCSSGSPQALSFSTTSSPTTLLTHRSYALLNPVEELLGLLLDEFPPIFLELAAPPPVLQSSAIAVVQRDVQGVVEHARLAKYDIHTPTRRQTEPKNIIKDEWTGKRIKASRTTTSETSSTDHNTSTDSGTISGQRLTHDKEENKLGNQIQESGWREKRNEEEEVRGLYGITTQVKEEKKDDTTEEIKDLNELISSSSSRSSDASFSPSSHPFLLFPSSPPLSSSFSSGTFLHHLLPEMPQALRTVAPPLSRAASQRVGRALAQLVADELGKIQQLSQRMGGEEGKIVLPGGGEIKVNKRRIQKNHKNRGIHIPKRENKEYVQEKEETTPQITSHISFEGFPDFFPRPPTTGEVSSVFVALQPGFCGDKEEMDEEKEDTYSLGSYAVVKGFYKKCIKPLAELLENHLATYSTNSRRSEIEALQNKMTVSVRAGAAEDVRAQEQLEAERLKNATHLAELYTKKMEALTCGLEGNSIEALWSNVRRVLHGSQYWTRPLGLKQREFRRLLAADRAVARQLKDYKAGKERYVEELQEKILHKRKTYFNVRRCELMRELRKVLSSIEAVLEEEREMEAELAEAAEQSYAAVSLVNQLLQAYRASCCALRGAARGKRREAAAVHNLHKRVAKHVRVAWEMWTMRQRGHLAELPADTARFEALLDAIDQRTEDVLARKRKVIAQTYSRLQKKHEKLYFLREAGDPEELVGTFPSLGSESMTQGKGESRSSVSPSLELDLAAASDTVGSPSSVFEKQLTKFNLYKALLKRQETELVELQEQRQQLYGLRTHYASRMNLFIQNQQRQWRNKSETLRIGPHRSPPKRALIKKKPRINVPTDSASVSSGESCSSGFLYNRSSSSTSEREGFQSDSGLLVRKPRLFRNINVETNRSISGSSCNCKTGTTTTNSIDENASSSACRVSTIVTTSVNNRAGLSCYSGNDNYTHGSNCSSSASDSMDPVVAIRTVAQSEEEEQGRSSAVEDGSHCESRGLANQYLSVSDVRYIRTACTSAEFPALHVNSEMAKSWASGLLFPCPRDSLSCIPNMPDSILHAVARLPEHVVEYWELDSLNTDTSITLSDNGDKDPQQEEYAYLDKTPSEMQRLLDNVGSSCLGVDPDIRRSISARQPAVDSLRPGERKKDKKKRRPTSQS